MCTWHLIAMSEASLGPRLARIWCQLSCWHSSWVVVHQSQAKHVSPISPKFISRLINYALPSDHIGELCERSHNFLATYRKIDGAELISRNERNLDCTLTFQTHSILQRFMLRFEVLKLDCNDHLYIFDGAHAASTHKADISCRNTKQTLGTLFTRTNYITLKYVTDGWGTDNSFKLVITAIKDGSKDAWWILIHKFVPLLYYSRPRYYKRPIHFMLKFISLTICFTKQKTIFAFSHRAFLQGFSLYHEGILYPSRPIMW